VQTKLRLTLVVACVLFQYVYLLQEPGCLSLRDGVPTRTAYRFLHDIAQEGSVLQLAFYSLGSGGTLPQNKTSGACG
jgi:hypothetical protein